jgi:hypothetical protein
MTKKFNLDAIENQTARFISNFKRPMDEDSERVPDMPRSSDASRDDREAVEGKRPGRPKVKNRETRSMRINVLISPSIAEKLKKVSAIKRKSVNGLINTYLDERLDQEGDALKKFDEVFGNDDE